MKLAGQSDLIKWVITRDKTDFDHLLPAGMLISTIPGLGALRFRAMSLKSAACFSLQRKLYVLLLVTTWSVVVGTRWVWVTGYCVLVGPSWALNLVVVRGSCLVLVLLPCCCSLRAYAATL